MIDLFEHADESRWDILESSVEAIETLAARPSQAWFTIRDVRDLAMRTSALHWRESARAHHAAEQAIRELRKHGVVALADPAKPRSGRYMVTS